LIDTKYTNSKNIDSHIKCKQELDSLKELCEFQDNCLKKLYQVNTKWQYINSNRLFTRNKYKDTFIIEQNDEQFNNLLSTKNKLESDLRKSNEELNNLKKKYQWADNKLNKLSE